MNQHAGKNRDAFWLKLVGGTMKVLLGLGLKVLIGLCAVAVIFVGVILVGEVYSQAFQGQSCQHVNGFILKLGCGICKTSSEIAELFSTLPSDEEMITNFQRRQQDFERLAAIYREDLSVPGEHYLVPTPDIKQIMARIKVSAVSGDQVIWLPPDPYSNESYYAKVKERLMLEYARGNGLGKRRFSGVVFSYAYVAGMTRGGVYKQYHYLPFPPKVENGILVLPNSPDTGFPILVDTLNEPPPAGYLCGCREIEPHWYIERCRE